MIRIILVCLFLLTSCGKKEGEVPAPKAAKIDHETKVGEVTIHDNYAWMRDKNWPKEVTSDIILAHLQDENKYSEHFFKDLEETKDKFFNEMKGRIQLSDQSAYVKIDNYYYYVRTEEEKGYSIYCRRFGSMEAPEEIILDVNKLAEGKKFTKVAAVSINPTHSKLAYNVDFSGDEKYVIRILDLEKGEYLSDSIEDVAGDIVWHRNLPGFFYTPINKELRTDTVMYHEVGSSNDTNKIIFEEKDPKYHVGISQSGSQKYLFIEANGLSDSEISLLSLEDIDLTKELIQARQKNIQYSVEHNGDYIYMLTNDVGPNFRITRSAIKDISDNHWAEYIPLDKDRALEDFDITEDLLILNYKVKGLPLTKVLHLKSGKAQIVSFPDESYTAQGFSTNFIENDIRVSYSSLARPNTTYLYDFEKNKLNILKEQVIPSGHIPGDYEVKRIWADNKGVKVRMSLVYKKSLFKHDGTNPLYLYGYGSYGMGMEPAFRSSIISLVDRGFVYVIAHVRGGNELGYQWYLDAKFLNKKNTFEDFIACAETLIAEKYTSEGNIVSMGGSAGGILVGATVNMRPELFKAVVAHVPFVDVLNTMLDETLPLTPCEYNEWGNPKEKEYFEYIKSYSPYDNVSEQEYPYIFVTAGLNDPRVGYWEAAKWVARLREIKKDDNLVILKTNMEAGHQGSSDRFDYIKEIAEEYAFISKVFGMKL